MCFLVQRRRDAVMMVVMVMVRDVGMVVVVMMRYLGMWHGMVMMVVMMVMMVMRHVVIRWWSDLLARRPHFVFPRGKRLMNGRYISRQMRGMMVVMVVMVVMVRPMRWCLVVLLILGYRTWVPRHLIGRSWNRHGVRS